MSNVLSIPVLLGDFIIRTFYGGSEQIKIKVVATAARSRICKRLRGPGIDSEEKILLAYVALRAGMTNRVGVPAHQELESIPRLPKKFTNTGSGYIGWRNRILGSIPGLLKSF
jgi:hypothetical protein